MQTETRMEGAAAQREADRPRSPELAQVRRIFDAQRARRWDMAATDARARVERLSRLRSAILRRRDELFAAVRGDFGKPPEETEVTELQPVLIELGHTIRHLARWMKPRRVGSPLLLAGARGEIRCEAKGQVLILSPWNYPFLLSIDPLVGAIAAGNVVTMRPSERVPRTSAFIRSLVEEVFPEDEVAVLLGGRDVADALLDLPFDHIFFTGSTAVGKKVMAAAARHLASVTLELGGKSPAFVDESANVQDAATRIVWGKFVNAGQSCIAPDYVLVHHRVEEAFVRAVKARVAAQYGPTEEARAASPDFCRIVDRGAVERLERTLRATIDRGATVELGGGIDLERRYVAPTVLTNVTGDAPIMEGEIFGPILPILRYHDVEEAIAYVRGRPKPLALYVFAESARATERILRRTTAGGTTVNNVLLHLANPELPYGGVNESGIGSYHGEFGFRTTFSHERAVLRQGRLSLAERLYPPYRTSVRRMLALGRRLTR